MVKKVSTANFAPRRDNFFTKNKPKHNNKRNENPNNKTVFRKSFHSNKVEECKFKRNFAARDEGAATSASGSFFVKPINKEVESPSQKSRNADATVEERKEKRPFDKKQWRLKKYSKKYKLDQWEDKRKKAVLREYYKEVKDDVPKFDVQKIYDQDSDKDEEENDNENNLNTDINIAKNAAKTGSKSKKAKDKLPPKNVEAVIEPENEQTVAKKPQLTNSKTKKNIAFQKAHVEFQRIKDEKIAKKEEIEKKKAEKLEALQEYKKKKFEKFKKLNKKTKKGQPIMKERMEMLLEQIQSSMQ